MALRAKGVRADKFLSLVLLRASLGHLQELETGVGVWG